MADFHHPPSPRPVLPPRPPPHCGHTDVPRGRSDHIRNPRTARCGSPLSSEGRSDFVLLPPALPVTLAVMPPGSLVCPLQTISRECLTLIPKNPLLPSLPGPIHKQPPPGSLPFLPALKSCECAYALSLALSLH